MMVTGPSFTIHLHVLTEHSLLHGTHAVDLLQLLDHMLIDQLETSGDAAEQRGPMPG